MSTRSTAREHTLGGICNPSILWDGLSCKCGCTSFGPQRGGRQGGVQGGMTCKRVGTCLPTRARKGAAFSPAGGER